MQHAFLTPPPNSLHDVFLGGWKPPIDDDMEWYTCASSLIPRLPAGKPTYQWNGMSPFSIGNTSSIRVHFPASYVSLPECMGDSIAQSPLAFLLLNGLDFFRGI